MPSWRNDVSVDMLAAAKILNRTASKRFLFLDFEVYADAIKILGP